MRRLLLLLLFAVNSVSASHIEEWVYDYFDEKKSFSEFYKVDGDSAQKITKPANELVPKAISGDRHVITFLLNYLDKKATDTTSVEQVTGYLYQNPLSAKNNYTLSSFGKINLVTDTDGDGKPDVFILSIDDELGSTCNASLIARQAKKEAVRQGFDLSQYEHVMYVLPRTAKCGWGGLGVLGCVKQCNTWIKWNKSLVYAHELGHNFGMHHASTDLDNNGKIDCEYCDHSGIMGNGGYKLVNAPHRYQMGYYSDMTNLVKFIPGGALLRLDSLDLNPLTTSISSQIGVITRDKMPFNYFLSYRTKDSIFGMGEKYNGLVSVHRFGTRGRTYLVKTLGIGDRFYDQYYGIDVRNRGVVNGKAVLKIFKRFACTIYSMPCDIANGTYTNLTGRVNFLRVKATPQASHLIIKSMPTNVSTTISLIVDKDGFSKKHECVVESSGTAECDIKNPGLGYWYIRVFSAKRHDNYTVTTESIPVQS